LAGLSIGCSNRESRKSSEGAILCVLSRYSGAADKPCIIRKRDGGYNYATTDIATIDYRIGDLKRDALLVRSRRATNDCTSNKSFEIARREGAYRRFPTHPIWQHPW
jgi:arginyl-tRNA synthetase